MDLTHLSSNLKLKTDFNAGETLGLRDINSITGVVDNSVTSLQALIFPNRNAEDDDRNPTRFDVTGITSGYDNKCFVFDIKKEYKLNLNSDITDHYVEDNVAIQDHIGLKPVILEVLGSIGEVTLKDKVGEQSDLDNYLKNQKDQNIFNSVDSYLGRMGSLTSFTPNIINQSLDVYNTAKFGYSTVSKVINLDKRDSTSSRRFAYNSEYDEDVIAQTKQFEWVNWFKIQWWNRASFTIVTPYGVLTDMYILDLSASQPENTRYVTNLSIKFKQIRKAHVIEQSIKTGQKLEVQQTKAVEDKTEEKIPLAQLGHSQTENNIGANVKDDKYTIVKSDSTSTASYNVRDGENSITKESQSVISQSFQDSFANTVLNRKR